MSWLLRIGVIYILLFNTLGYMTVIWAYWKKDKQAPDLHRGQNMSALFGILILGIILLT